jgi:hypothetical protein
MGSWNGTCALSQMPIVHGEKVVLFPLVKSPSAENGGGGYCYSTNQYSPMTIPLFGVFDDYGGIEKIDKNKEYVYNLFKLFEEKKMFKKDEYEYDRQVSINSSFTGTIQSIEELVDVYLREPVYQGTGYMLIHQNIYQKVVDEIGLRKSYSKTKTIKEGYIEDVLSFLEELEKIKGELPHLEGRFKELREKYKETEDKNYLRESFKILEKMSLFEGETSNFDRLFSKNNFVRYFYQIDAAQEFNWEAISYLANLEKEKAQELAFQYVDLILFHIAMRLARKTWSPQSGAGSQTKEYFLHKIIAESILEKEKSVKKSKETL